MLARGVLSCDVGNRSWGSNIAFTGSQIHSDHRVLVHSAFALCDWGSNYLYYCLFDRERQEEPLTHFFEIQYDCCCQDLFREISLLPKIWWKCQPWKLYFEGRGIVIMDLLRTIALGKVLRIKPVKTA